MPLPQRYSYRDTPARASGNAARLWEEGLPISGTLAERYLTLRRLEPPADDLRFHPRCPYRPNPWTTFHPALLVTVREGRRPVGRASCGERVCESVVMSEVAG